MKSFGKFEYINKKWFTFRNGNFGMWQHWSDLAKTMCCSLTSRNHWLQLGDATTRNPVEHVYSSHPPICYQKSMEVQRNQYHGTTVGQHLPKIKHLFCRASLVRKKLRIPHYLMKVAYHHPRWHYFILFRSYHILCRSCVLLHKQKCSSKLHDGHHPKSVCQCDVSPTIKYLSLLNHLTTKQDHLPFVGLFCTGTI
jgi:hypothetical protein